MENMTPEQILTTETNLRLSYFVEAIQKLTDTHWYNRDLSALVIYLNKQGIDLSEIATNKIGAAQTLMLNLNGVISDTYIFEKTAWGVAAGIVPRENNVPPGVPDLLYFYDVLKEHGVDPDELSRDVLKYIISVVKLNSMVVVPPPLDWLNPELGVPEEDQKAIIKNSKEVTNDFRSRGQIERFLESPEPLTSADRRQVYLLYQTWLYLENIRIYAKFYE
jgi:hypothetical protein